MMLALALGCGSGDDQDAAPEQAPPATAEATPAPPTEPARWVGSAVCAECHAEESTRWRSSDHARALQEPSPETVLGDFGAAIFREGRTTWKLARADASYRVRSEGAEQGEYEVAYTLGVDPLQQYLIAFPDGRLQALHVAWDARPREAGGQRWFVPDGETHPAPGDPAHWRGPAHTANALCIECHATGFRKDFDLAANRYETRWAEAGVGCEACHGPASRHVEWARAAAGSTGGATDRGLVAHFEAESGAPSREIDACGVCHSQRGAIRDVQRAGDPLLDGYEPALLERDLFHDDGQVAQEAYEWGSFVQTRKYAAGVRCSDCHDPHSSALRADGNALCADCHEAARFDAPEHHHHPASPTPSCVDCHMPERTFRAIDARRDHGFHIPRPDLTLEIGTPNACSTCHAQRGDAWAAKAVQSWRGDSPPPRHFAERLHERRSGGTEAGRELASLLADETMPAIARATALIELAAAPSREHVDKASRAQDPLLRLAAARAGVGLSARERVLGMARLLDDPLRAVRIEAAITLSDVPREGLSERQREAHSRALDDYRAAQAVAADSPASHVNLALLAQRLGDAKAAEESFLTALRIGDYFVPAYTGLSELYAAQNRDGDGATLLHRGLERAPDSADLHFALGLLLERQKQSADALEELAAAARLAPEAAYYSYVHALALNEQKRPGEALAVLRRAAKRHPADQNLLGLLALIARDAGRLDEALAAAKQLEALFPNQPETRALVEDIESRRAGGPGTQATLPP